ncbi:MAG: Rieske 2Fe-2S domain-containing protein [Acidimicrobiales bacterium]
MVRALANTDAALRRCWHPVARPAEVTERPIRVRLLGQAWVLYRVAGRVVAFEDRCPHRHCPLSLGTNEAGLLRCAYHGWRFDGQGTCVEIPALGPGATLPPSARLSPPAGLAEAHGMVFLAPEDPIAPLGAIPEADDPAFVAGELPTLEARAAAGLLADNFLDVAHFPFVHAGTFGADEAAVVPPFVVAREGWSFTVSYEHAFANREDPGVAAGTRPLVQTRRLTYRLDAPFHLRLRIDFVEAGGSNVIGFFIQPETADSCRVFTTLWRDDLAGDPARMADAIAFEVAVLREDLRVQEAYDELVLPLHPGAEVHTRADRATLELRRVLADLVAAAADAVG